jgi:hypothetical protein
MNLTQLSVKSAETDLDRIQRFTAVHVADPCPKRTADRKETYYL